MMYFGVGLNGRGIGRYRQGTDSPYVMNDLSNRAGGQGTVVGFYGQTLKADN